MTSGASLDAREVRQFSADLTAASQRVVDRTPKVIAVGATKIKAQLREEMDASEWFDLSRAIGYDLRDGGFEAEIGPSTGAPGSLANIAYFGGANGGGGTVPDPQGALDAEAPHVERALLDLIGEV